MELELELVAAHGALEADLSPDAAKKLKPIALHYLAQPRPFTQCVIDQKKHGLSEDHAKARCAELLDHFDPKRERHSLGEVMVVQSAGYMSWSPADEAATIRDAKGRFAKTKGAGVPKPAAGRSGLKGALTSVVGLGGGSSETFTAELGGQKVAIKNRAKGTSARLKGQIDSTKGPEHGRASLRIGDAMGVKMPNTAVRKREELDGVTVGLTDEVMVVEFVKPSESLKPADMKKEGSAPVEVEPDAAERIAVFDYLIGNIDRKPGNWLRSGDDYVLIDHDLSFPTSPPNAYNSFEFEDDDGPMTGRPLTTPIKNDLDQMLASWDAWKKKLAKDGLSDEEIDGVGTRLDKMVRDPSWPDMRELFENGQRPRDERGPGGVRGPHVWPIKVRS